MWAIIRDFYVEYIFGGTLSNGYLRGTGTIGSLLAGSNRSQAKINETYIPLALTKADGTTYSYINFGDWLSTTATIITLVVMVFLLFLLVRWVYKICAGLFTLRG